MIFFKILQKFLSPSVFILILILLGLVFLFKFKKKKVGKLLVVIGLIFYFLFSITPTADLILRPLENQYVPVPLIDISQPVPIDKIVLLTGSMVLRSSEVLRLYNSAENINKDIKIIISGIKAHGQDRDKEIIETKRFLIERGVSPEDIIIEAKSRNTMESAKNIENIVDEEPFFLVTSAYHMPRSMQAFQRVGANPIPAPTDFKIDNDYSLFDFFPNPANSEKANLAFHEYFGILYYKLTI